jgi:hypothetical protein
VTGTKTAARDVSAEIAYLTRALKAPTLRESAGRLRRAGPHRIVDP